MTINLVTDRLKTGRRSSRLHGNKGLRRSPEPPFTSAGILAQTWKQDGACVPIEPTADYCTAAGGRYFVLVDVVDHRTGIVRGLRESVDPAVGVDIVLVGKHDEDSSDERGDWVAGDDGRRRTDRLQRG